MIQFDEHLWSHLEPSIFARTKTLQSLPKAEHEFQAVLTFGFFCLRWFFTFYQGKSPFGRICLSCFPTTKHANLSLVDNFGAQKSIRFDVSPQSLNLLLMANLWTSYFRYHRPDSSSGDWWSNTLGCNKTRSAADFFWGAAWGGGPSERRFVREP